MKLRKKTLFAGAAIAGAVTMVGVAWALPQNAYEKIYYSDAAHTQIVGGEEYMCIGSPHLWGTRTGHYTQIVHGDCDDLYPPFGGEICDPLPDGWCPD